MQYNFSSWLDNICKQISQFEAIGDSMHIDYFHETKHFSDGKKVKFYNKSHGINVKKSRFKDILIISHHFFEESLKIIESNKNFKNICCDLLITLDEDKSQKNLNSWDDIFEYLFSEEKLNIKKYKLHSPPEICVYHKDYSRIKTSEYHDLPEINREVYMDEFGFNKEEFFSKVFLTFLNKDQIYDHSIIITKRK